MANLGIGAGPLDFSGLAAARQAQQAEMAAAQQRVAALQRELTKGRDRTGGEILTDTGLGLASGVVGLGQAAYGLGNLATGGLLDRGVGLSDNFHSWQQGIRGAQSEPLQYRREDANAAFDDSLWEGAKAYLTDPSLIGDLLSQAAPSLIPPIAAGSIAARTAGAVGSQALAQQAARRAVLGTTAAQVGGATNVDAINTIAAQGGSATEQQLGGVGAGLTAGALAPLIAMGTGAYALEGALATRLAGGAGMGTSVARGAAIGAGRESVEEALQSASEQASINAVAPDSSLLDNTGRAAVLGGIAGFGLGGPMGAIAAPGRRNAQPTAEQTPAGPTATDTTTDLFGLQAQWDTLLNPQAPAQGAPDFELGEQAPNRQGEFDFAAPDFELGEQFASRQQELALAQDEDPENFALGLQIVQGQLDLDSAPAAAQKIAGDLVDQMAAIQAVQEQQALNFDQSAQPGGRAIQNPDGQMAWDFNFQPPGDVDLFGQPTRLQRQVPGTPATEQDPFAPNALNQPSLFGEPSPFQQRIDGALGIGARGETQPLTEEEVRQQQAERTLAAYQQAQRDGVDLQNFLDPERQRAGVTQDDLRTRQQDTAEANRAREEEVLNTLFRVSQDDNGRPVYQRYNADLQVMETVQRGTALKAAKDEIKRQDAEAAERARPPADRWRDNLTTRLGVKKQVLRGKQWDQFAEQVNTLGIHPESEQAGEFLREMAATLGQDEASASRFGIALAEAYPPPSVLPEPPESVDISSWNLPPRTPQADTQTTPEAAPEATPEVAEETDAIDMQREADTLAIQSGIYEYMEANRINNKSIASRRYFEQTIDEAPSENDLESAFQAMIQTSEFQSLSAKSQEALVKRYSDRYDTVAPGKFIRVGASDARNVDTRTAAQRAEDEANAARTTDTSQAPPRRRRPRRRTAETARQTPLSSDRARDILAEATQALSGNQTAPFIVHETVEDYRGATFQAAPPDAAGVFDADGVHVILENIETEEQLAEVIAHERGHEGMKGLLGDRLVAVTNRLWANAALRERIKTKMATQSLDRATAAEEVLVDMIAAGERLNGDVFSKVRAGLTSLFQSILGVGKYRITDSQVNRLLDSTAAYMRGRSVAADIGSLTAANIELDSLIGDPAPVLNSPRFSRVYETLNKTVSAGDPAPGNYNRLDRAVKEAMGATRDALSGYKHSVKSGEVWRDKLGGFVPLNQIANLYGDRFKRRIENEDGSFTETNPLQDVAEEKRRKEARANQLLTRKQDLARGDYAVEASMHDISEAMAALQRKSPGQADALNQTLQMASFYQVWPDRSWDDQPAVDYQRLKMTEDERKQAHRDLQQLYKRAGRTGQDLFQQSQAAYRFLWQTRLDALETALNNLGVDVTDPTRGGRMLELARRELGDAPYSPLQRYGDNLVIVRNADGSTAWFEAFESTREAEIARNTLGQSLEDGQRIQITKRGERDFVQAGLNQQQLDALEANLDAQLPPDADAGLRKRLRDVMVETYLKMIPESSFTQFSNRRQNIGGFNANGTRAFNNYALKASRAIASLEHDGKIAEHLRSMEQHIADLATDTNADTRREVEVLNQVRRQHQASEEAEYSKVANVLSGAAFLQFMTSPSQLYVNAMQTFLVAAPRLMAEYSAGAGRKAFTDGMQAFIKSGGDMLSEKASRNQTVDSTTRNVLQAMYENGVLDFTLANDMTGEARGDSSQMNATWRKFMQWSGVFMHKSEMFNRQTTAYAAVQLERTRNPQASTEQLVERATRAVYDTHFDYSQSNRAAIAQGPVGKLAFQFWQYRLNMMAMMAKDVRDGFLRGDIDAEERSVARRALAYQLGSQLALTGVAGTAMAPFVFAIMGAFDDEDFIDGRTAFIESQPQIISHGILAGVFGLDTARLDTGSIFPFLGEGRYAPTNANPDETSAYYATQFLGPWFGMARSYYKGLTEVAGGDMYKGMQSMLPKPMSDVLKAWDERDGVRSNDGTVYHQPSAFGGISQALGMRTADRATASNRLGAAYQASSNISTARKNHLTRLAVAQAVGDNEDYQSAMADIRQWNQTNPNFAIAAEDIGRTLTSQVKSQSNADRYGLPLSRNVTTQFLDVAGQ